MLLPQEKGRIPRDDYWTLNDLTKKLHQWKWGADEQASFDTLKDLCSSYPVL